MRARRASEATERSPARWSTIQEHHEPARDVERHHLPVIVVHELEGQIDARGDSRRREDVAVAHEDGIALHPHGGKAALKTVAEGPVRGDAPAVEQPGFREQERARAHGGDAPGAARRARDPAHEVLIPHGRA
jgi:hypothetical protein